MFASSQVILVVHRSMADGRPGDPCPIALPHVVLVSKPVFDNATTLRMVIILFSHKELSSYIGQAMAVQHARAIILTWWHAIRENVQLERGIDAIQNARNTEQRLGKHFFQQPFQKMQINVSYIVERMVKRLLIPGPLFQQVWLILNITYDSSVMTHKLLIIWLIR